MVNDKESHINLVNNEEVMKLFKVPRTVCRIHHLMHSFTEHKGVLSRSSGCPGLMDKYGMSDTERQLGTKERGLPMSLATLPSTHSIILIAFL